MLKLLMTNRVAQEFSVGLCMYTYLKLVRSCLIGFCVSYLSRALQFVLPSLLVVTTCLAILTA